MTDTSLVTIIRRAIREEAFSGVSDALVAAAGEVLDEHSRWSATSDMYFEFVPEEIHAALTRLEGVLGLIEEANVRAEMEDER